MSRTIRNHLYRGLVVEIASDARFFPVTLNGKVVATLTRRRATENRLTAPLMWTVAMLDGRTIHAAAVVGSCLRAVHAELAAPAVLLGGRDLGCQHDAHCTPWTAVRALAGAIADIARAYEDEMTTATFERDMHRRHLLRDLARRRRCEAATYLARDCITLDIRHQPRA